MLLEHVEIATWSKTIEKMLPVLGGVVVGALLTAFIASYKDWRKRHRLIRALYVELNDESRWLLRSKLFVERMIRECACNHMPDGVPVAAPTHIYDQHIAELAFYLTASERISFNAIHSFLAQVRKQHEELAEIRVKFSPGDVPSFNRYVQLLHASYSNLCLLVCYVVYHLDFRRRVDVNRVTGDDARQVEKNTRERLNQLISEAKTMGIDAVREEYFRDEPSAQSTITGKQLIRAVDEAD
jgi:hypothetical protein